MIQVLFVCLGNICRSPLAEAVFDHLLHEKKLIKKIKSDSAGTGAWHVGNDPDPRSVAVAARYKIPMNHKARQFIREDLEQFDYVLAMDHSNYDNILRTSGVSDAAASDGLFLMRDFDPEGKGNEVPDPYYGGEEGFDKVYHMLKRSCEGLLEHIAKEHDLTAVPAK